MKILFPFLILLGAVAVFFVISKPEKVSETEPEPLPPRKVETILASAEDITRQIETQGFVCPRLETHLSSEISGKVVATSDAFFPGEFVRKGDILVELEDADYQAAFSRVQAQVAKRALELAEEEARVEQAKADWERLNTTTASALTLREPQLAQAHANLEAALADLAQATRNVERTEIRAPFDALVKSRGGAEGQFVNPGMAIGLLYAIDYAEVRLPILAKDLGYIALPQPGAETVSSVKIVDPDSGQAGVFAAKLVRSENFIDSADRVLYAVAQVADPYGWVSSGEKPPLRIGSFVTAYIESRPYEGVFRLPRIALRGDAQLAVVRPDETIEIRDITMSYLDGAYVYVGSGIQEGDRVCLTSPQTLYNGTRVVWTEED